ncbi:MAG: hypothetical protein IT336_03110 [Thermomicrobiales bacterium]|nr:hypothetical protein [Thermomicrobiales bacterium]
MDTPRVARRFVHVALVALFVGLALIGPGRLQGEVGAQKKGPIYPSAEAYMETCRKLGGTYSAGLFLHYCTLPNGHVVACDLGFNACWLVVGMTVDDGGSGGGTVDPRGDVYAPPTGDLEIVQEPARPSKGGRIVAAETPIAASS